MKNEAKKVVLFIVEGPTEETAFGDIFQKLFDKDKVHFHVVHGDITIQNNISPINAVKTLNEYINAELKVYPFKRSDIIQIIHVVDTDGAFIPAECVMLSETKENRVEYFPDCIKSPNAEYIIKRNAQKSSVIKKLISIKGNQQNSVSNFLFVEESGTCSLE